MTARKEPNWDAAPTVEYAGDLGPIFYRVCPTCYRPVKPDGEVMANEELGMVHPGPNATCRKCGRINMPFIGWRSDFEAVPA